MPTALTIFFAHANGFPAPCYETLFRRLAPHSIDYIPVMGEQITRPENWQELADELVEVISSRHKKPVVGVGHSFGGVAIFLAARKRPDLFSEIIILDPPLFGRVRRWLAAPFQWLNLGHLVVPPAKKALTRRDQFGSFSEAREYFRTKRFFQSFDEEAFEAYIRHGLVESAGGVTLRIPKEKEARYFAVFPSVIGPTRLPMPGHYVIPTDHGVLPPSHVPELKQKFASWSWHELPGNHMFPLEHPQETADLILNILA